MDIGRVRSSEHSAGEVWLGDYQLISRIGSGGSGTVYLARHAPSGQHVALKVLSSRATADAEFVARFQREADAISSLDHPNIVHVFEAGCADGRCFIAMAYLNYGTLKDRIAAIRAGGEQMPVVEALEAARQIATALDYAHQRGLIHRDVKPANILLAAGGHYVLTDFGTVLVQTATRLTTSTGRLLGTAEYLSPEQANQQPFDHRVDIYALGVVLYEMLTGCAPFSAENDMLVVYAHAHREPRPIHEIRAGVPRGVVRIVTKAMHKLPAQRYATAGEMALDIERVLDELEHGTTSRLNARQRALIAGSALVVCVIVLLASALSSAAQARARLAPASTFHTCDVAFIVAHTPAPLLDAPTTDASAISNIEASKSLTVLGRSGDGNWLWVVSQAHNGAGWIAKQAGDVIGTLRCVPVVPAASTVSPKEE